MGTPGEESDVDKRNSRPGSSEVLGLISSGDYCSAEIVAEYGTIPPAFLPHGQRRLFEWQVKLLSKWCSKLAITLPASYSIPEADSKWLEVAGVVVVPSDESLSLGASISAALDVLAHNGPMYLLHGDTLFRDLDAFPIDSVAVAPPKGSYMWGRLEARSAETDVIAGLFSMASAADFASSLEKGGGDFLSALVEYRDVAGIQEVTVDNWLDFGHLQNLYYSRRDAPVHRFFNGLRFEGRTVEKFGTDTLKIVAEGRWFDALPPIMRVYTPPFLGLVEDRYFLGYEPNPNLQDLYLFGKFRSGTWREILGACFEFLSLCRDFGEETGDPDVLRKLGPQKTRFRLSQWAEQNDLDTAREWVINSRSQVSLEEILDVTDSVIGEAKPTSALMHGDFCFSNIFYDFRQGQVRVVDPRGGVTLEKPTIMGALEYDLAKLNHSLVAYDQILAGRFSLLREGEYRVDFRLYPHPGRAELLSMLRDFQIEFFGTADATVSAITIQLFLSMLPLHSDQPQRQMAFLATAFELFSELVEG